jgi:hypothetical protein
LNCFEFYFNEGVAQNGDFFFKFFVDITAQTSWLTMKTVQVFLSDYEFGRHILSSIPVEMTFDQVRDELEHMSGTKGCFIGLIFESREVAQFIWNDDENESITLDVPIPNRCGSLEKEITFQDLGQIIDSLEQGIRPSHLLGLRFKHWE